MSDYNSAQFSMFKDCVARRTLVRSDYHDATNESSELDEFSSYLALESWPTLPATLRSASYESRLLVPDVDTLSLDSTPTSFIDTLISYGFASDSEESLGFLRKAVADYIQDACAPPPVWSSTRLKECEICDREVPLTYHHLIPRSIHAKVLKKKWHPEGMLNSVAWLCRPCHSVVHGVASNEELAREYHTIELLLQREDVQKWRKYAAKQRFGVRRG